MTTYNIPKHDGFKHLNPKLSDYEKAVTGIFNEMKLRQQDKDVENMQRSNLIIKNKMMGRLGDIYSSLLDVAGRLNDVVNGHFSDVIGDKNTDANAVQLGMRLFEKYGTNLKKSDLEREVFDNRAKLNRYERKDLIEKWHTVSPGDTIFNIAKQNNIAPEEILHKNP